MPRRSTHQSDKSPAPRRTSARIAAVQAASPAKAPAKSTPRRKRQSTESAKTASEDTESQPSQAKSEVSMEELNGLETSSSTKDTSESVELPSKKAKYEDGEAEASEPEIQMVTPTKINTSTCSDSGLDQSEDVRLPEIEPVRPMDLVPEKIPDVASIPAHAPISPAEFEVVEKSDVPAPDSAEVKAAIAVQGEEGRLLAGFVQVAKDELPAATSLEVKQVTPSEECENRPLETIPEVTENTVQQSVTPINGDTYEEPSATEPVRQTDNVIVAESIPTELPPQVKSLPVDDIVSPPERAAGDITPASNPELTSQL